MPVYISSNANRFYCAPENGYGNVAAITSANRIPAVKLTAKQQREVTARKDKTGSRTFGGLPSGGRRKTTFDLRTYLTTWPGSNPPAYGALVQGALGAAPLMFAGAPLAAGSSSTSLRFAAPHGLVSGQAVTYLGELRFVSAVINPSTVQLNAPLSSILVVGASLGPTATYLPSTELPSISIFDYWAPTTAVHRILCGAGVDQMSVKINGDFHEFQFTGVAQELIDSASFSGDVGQLTAFPTEPALSAFDYSIVPGHLGQVWLGNAPVQFNTVTDAQLVVKNNLDMRARSTLPLALSPGVRAVTIDFQLFQKDDAATQQLYQSAKQQSPITATLQLGQQPNQLFGAYLKSFLPEVPEYDDSSTRLQWHFRSSRAEGTTDDEISIAFG